MHRGSLPWLVCLGVMVCVEGYIHPERRQKIRSPPAVVVLPPGVDLCMEGLPTYMCSIKYGGGRGPTLPAGRSIAKRLEKRGWVRTEKLPRQLNSIHICCDRKKFGMEKKPVDPKTEKPIEWPPKKNEEQSEETEESLETSESFKTSKTSMTKRKTNATSQQERRKNKPGKRSDKIEETKGSYTRDGKNKTKEATKKNGFDEVNSPQESKGNKTKETNWKNGFDEVNSDRHTRRKNKTKETTKKNGFDEVTSQESKNDNNWKTRYNEVTPQETKTKNKTKEDVWNDRFDGANFPQDSKKKNSSKSLKESVRAKLPPRRNVSNQNPEDDKPSGKSNLW